MKATDGRIRPLGTEIILSPQLRSSSVVAALVVSPTGQILAANDCLLRLVGGSMPELVGKNAQTLMRPADWESWVETAATGEQAARVDIELTSRDGRTVYLRGDIEAVAAPNGRQWLSGLFVDAAAARHFDASISHASRMEALASLTSGIAHDFSNLLTVLVGNLYLISEGLRGDPALFEKAKLARDAAKRGIDLVRQLLSFARNEWDRTPTVDLRKIIGHLEPLVKRALGARIALSVHVGEGVMPVAANAGQLESAIVNLVINARDAIEAAGEIKVGVTTVLLDPRNAEAYGVPPGSYISIAVQDSGAGIPQHLLGRVFDPFFSTKGEGKGTGLGLPMVRLFAIQSGGTVLLASEAGKGTTVTILLPSATEATEATTSQTMPLSALPGGKETILVFAEDEDVRRTIEQILGVLGYNVILGSDWQTSLETLRSTSAHLALIDIKALAASPGIRLLQAARRLKPPVRTVIIRDSMTVHHAGIATLHKPFDLSALATTVRRVLDGEYDER